MKKTFEVYLNDGGVNYEDSEKYFSDADLWAATHCASYCGHYVQDVSDVSYVYDNIAEYVFKDERDVVAFTLRWK